MSKPTLTRGQKTEYTSYILTAIVVGFFIAMRLV